jgi:hypothetical protein
MNTVKIDLVHEKLSTGKKVGILKQTRSLFYSSYDV